MSAMLSTIDNPFNPFEDFDSWYNYDVSHGYNSSAYLMRIAKPSEALNEFLNEEEIERAIDEIVELNINGLFIKVYEDSQIKPISLNDVK